MEMTLDEVREMGVLLSKIASGEIDQAKLEALENGDLTDEDLEGVSGGLLFAAGTLLITGLLVGSLVAMVKTHK